MRAALGCFLLVACIGSAGPAACADKPHVVFVVGTPHYEPAKILPPLARQLADKFDFRVTVILPEDDPERSDAGIEGLEALDTADVAVFFLRFLTLPEEQFAHIERYFASGKPMIGLSTSTHAFTARLGDKSVTLEIPRTGKEWPDVIVLWIRRERAQFLVPGVSWWVCDPCGCYWSYCDPCCGWQSPGATHELRSGLAATHAAATGV